MSEIIRGYGLSLCACHGESLNKDLCRPEPSKALITINAITQKYVQLLDSAKDTPIQHNYIESMLVELTSAVRDYKLAMGSYSDPVRKVIEYINLHLGSEILLDDLSAAANVSPSHLSKIFKKDFAITPSAYRKKNRSS